MCAACVACGGEGTKAESETHFLRACDSACGDGLACICGVCTKPCDEDDTCTSLAASAMCAQTPSACSDDVRSACEMTCAKNADCAELGDGYRCAAGYCRASTSGGTGGTSGVGQGGSGASGQGAAGSSGQGSAGNSGQGSAGDSGEGGGGGAGQDGAGDGGAGGVAGTAGSGGDGGAGAAGSGDTCGAADEPCCDPFPGDGSDYCDGALRCEAPANVCVDCQCVRGAFFPVCGVDGQTYDASCGRACVDAEIACDGQCPCQCVTESNTGCASSEPNGGQACCGGLVCCEGVPYDEAGECRVDCPFLSDRAQKTDIRLVDTDALLESVARLPISSWRYRAQPEASHVGPMAQDFAAELGLGSSDRVIEPVDASGVALAAIKALHQRVESLANENRALVERVAELESRAVNACEPR